MALSLNIGFMGHVDSGKTSLAKCLSEVASTAAFDKNPQSQARQITLDLGFSGLSQPVPQHIGEPSYERLQYTFVDCPGHASLVRTIIGGAQIIDIILLVIDIGKGFQTQTAECLVIGELTCDRMIVALNKIDTIPAGERQKLIDKMTKKLTATLSGTKFAGCAVVPVSAHSPPQNIDRLIETLNQTAFVPCRRPSAPFLFAVDHCFAIRGQGTVCTGTVLQGTIALGDTVEVAHLRTTKKVKSIQMFRQPLPKAMHGDRVGICLHTLDANAMERGMLAEPGLVRPTYTAVLRLNVVKYFKHPIASKMKLHISIGYDTVLAEILLFGSNDSAAIQFDERTAYEYIACWSEELQFPAIFVLLKFEQPVLCTPAALVIASKLDVDTHTTQCRIAFWGHIQMEERTPAAAAAATVLTMRNLRIYKTKIKEATVQRVVTAHELITANLFRKTTKNRHVFVGMHVDLSTGERGTIASTFGQTAKMRLSFIEPLSESTLNAIRSRHGADAVTVTLKFKKYIFDTANRITQ